MTTTTQTARRTATRGVLGGRTLASVRGLLRAGRTENADRRQFARQVGALPATRSAAVTVGAPRRHRAG